MSDEGANRGYHDMGGDAAGAVERGEHVHQLWEKRIDAMMVLLSDADHRLMRVDELRRTIESLGPEAYDSLSYYERWTQAISLLMVEKGIVGRDELDARVAKMKAERGAAP